MHNPTETVPERVRPATTLVMASFCTQDWRAANLGVVMEAGQMLNEGLGHSQHGCES